MAKKCKRFKRVHSKVCKDYVRGKCVEKKTIVAKRCKEF